MKQLCDLDYGSKRAHGTCVTTCLCDGSNLLRRGATGDTAPEAMLES